MSENIPLDKKIIISGVIIVVAIILSFTLIKNIGVLVSSVILSVILGVVIYFIIKYAESKKQENFQVMLNGEKKYDKKYVDFFRTSAYRSISGYNFKDTTDYYLLLGTSVKIQVKNKLDNSYELKYDHFIRGAKSYIKAKSMFEDIDVKAFTLNKWLTFLSELDIYIKNLEEAKEKKEPRVNEIISKQERFISFLEEIKSCTFIPDFEFCSYHSIYGLMKDTIHNFNMYRNLHYTNSIFAYRRLYYTNYSFNNLAEQISIYADKLKLLFENNTNYNLDFTVKTRIDKIKEMNTTIITLNKDLIDKRIGQSEVNIQRRKNEITKLKDETIKSLKDELKADVLPGNKVNEINSDIEKYENEVKNLEAYIEKVQSLIDKAKEFLETQETNQNILIHNDYIKETESEFGIGYWTFEKKDLVTIDSNIFDNIFDNIAYIGHFAFTGSPVNFNHRFPNLKIIGVHALSYLKDQDENKLKLCDMNKLRILSHYCFSYSNINIDIDLTENSLIILNEYALSSIKSKSLENRSVVKINLSPSFTHFYNGLFNESDLHIEIIGNNMKNLKYIGDSFKFKNTTSNSKIILDNMSDNLNYIHYNAFSNIHGEIVLKGYQYWHEAKTYDVVSNLTFYNCDPSKITFGILGLAFYISNNKLFRFYDTTVMPFFKLFFDLRQASENDHSNIIFGNLQQQPSYSYFDLQFLRLLTLAKLNKNKKIHNKIFQTEDNVKYHIKIADGKYLDYDSLPLSIDIIKYIVNNIENNNNAYSLTYRDQAKYFLNAYVKWCNYIPDNEFSMEADGGDDAPNKEYLESLSEDTIEKLNEIFKDIHFTNIKYIGKKSFYKCTRGLALKVGSVKKIGDSAFADISSSSFHLEFIYSESNTTSVQITRHAFKNYKGYLNINMYCSSLSVADEAFINVTEPNIASCNSDNICKIKLYGSTCILGKASFKNFQGVINIEKNRGQVSELHIKENCFSNACNPNNIIQIYEILNSKLDSNCFDNFKGYIILDIITASLEEKQNGYITDNVFNTINKSKARLNIKYYKNRENYFNDKPIRLEKLRDNYGYAYKLIGIGEGKILNNLVNYKKTLYGNNFNIIENKFDNIELEIEQFIPLTDSSITTPNQTLCNYIPDNEFMDNNSYNKETIDFSNIKYIGDNSFQNCDLPLVTINPKHYYLNNMIRIGNSAFENSNIKLNLLLNNSFKTLGTSCFKNFRNDLYFVCDSSNINNTGTETFYNINSDNNSYITFNIHNKHEEIILGERCFYNVGDKVTVSIYNYDNNKSNTLNNNKLEIDSQCFGKFKGFLNLDWEGNELDVESDWNDQSKFNEETRYCLLYNTALNYQINPNICNIPKNFNYSSHDLDFSSSKYNVNFIEKNINYDFKDLFNLNKKLKLNNDIKTIPNHNRINIIINLNSEIEKTPVTTNTALQDNLVFDKDNYIFQDISPRTESESNDENITTYSPNKETYKYIYKKIFFLILNYDKILDSLLDDNTFKSYVKIKYSYNNNTTLEEEKLNLSYVGFIFYKPTKDLYTFTDNTNIILIINDSGYNDMVELKLKKGGEGENDKEKIETIPNNIETKLSTEIPLNYYVVRNIENILNSNDIKCGIDQQLKIYNFSNIKTKQEFILENTYLNINSNDEICNEIDTVDVSLDVDAISDSDLLKMYQDQIDELEKVKDISIEQKNIKNNIINVINKINEEKMKIKLK